ncbi:MAG: hypothetical protein AB7F99_19700 [Vicinamibacterales bacterium]
MARRRLMVATVLLLASCGGNPNSPSNFAQIGGFWTGNMQSTNWAPVAINMQLTQAAGNINGTWAAPANDWNGTIAGSVTRTNFSGSFTFSGPNAAGVGPRCTGNASVSGAAGGITMNWTSPGFTGSCTGFPINVTWNLQ